MSEQILDEYYDALKRIKNGKPIRVGLSERLSLKAVAIEAGKSPGAIKKSRPIFHALIADIKLAMEVNKNSKTDDELAVQRYKSEANKWRKLYEDSIRITPAKPEVFGW